MIQEWSKILCASTPILHKANDSNRNRIDPDILSDTIHKDMLGPEGTCGGNDAIVVVDISRTILP